MIKDIKFSGYSTIPSDYECPDGQLTTSLNLISEDAQLKPLHKADLLFNIGDNNRLFIHKVVDKQNYLTYSLADNTIQWIASDNVKFTDPIPIDTTVQIGKIVSIVAIGYILIVSTNSGLYYIRYNANKDAYIFLGSKLPDIDIDFALKLNMEVEDVQDKTFDVVPTGSGSGSGTTTGDDDWNTDIATSYDASSANGQLSRENNRPGSPESLVSTTYVAFEPHFIIKKDVEYKLKWDVIAGCHYGMTLGIWGNRNGSSEREMLFWTSNERATANTIEVKKRFSDEWINICYQISFLYKDLSSADCGTRGNITWYKGIDNSGAGSDEVSLYIEYTPESHTSLMSAVNTFVNEQVTKKSKFLYPFFLRYAVKLFDGSYSKISEPVLMIPNSGYMPAVSFSKHSSLGTRLILTGFVADIQYKPNTAIEEEWQDLITGIDIFVSPPIWTYSQGQEYDASTNYLKFKSKVESYGFGRTFFNDIPCSDSSNYEKHSLSDYISRYATNILTNNYVEIAGKSADDIMKELESVSTFYKVCSLGYEEFCAPKYSFADIIIEKGVLSSLVAREVLNDDVLHYEGFKNGYLKEYNNRLNICHSEILLPLPTCSQNCFNYQTFQNEYDNVSVYIFLATADGQKMVVKDFAKTYIGGCWYFYPDTRAYKAVFVFKKQDITSAFAEIDLKPHNGLNGSYWRSDNLLSTMELISSATNNPCEGKEIDMSVPAQSSIYVSEAMCPFIFKSLSVVSVGAREVFALSGASKALSQGQFGQFPLYAFTAEGVWALEVSATGSYSARQPITRDVCINPESITQTDSEVLFVTDRGIMLISGSNTQCISDAINSETPFNVRQLKGIDKLHSLIGHNVDTCLPAVPFSTFIQGCGMLYDYVHQHIIVYNKDFTYCYVYSTRSNEWGMMYSTIAFSVNSYPEALAVDNNGRLLNFSATDGVSQKGLFITRPLKIEMPDVLKTMDNIIVRGHFKEGNVKCVLYGSRNLYNWHLVWSSKDNYLRGFRGSPYKYFRIACVTDLSEDESIFGATLQFTPRHTNQPR